MTTLQEYLNHKYPTRQDKERVKKINFFEIVWDFMRYRMLQEWPGLQEASIDEEKEKLVGIWLEELFSEKLELDLRGFKNVEEADFSLRELWFYSESSLKSSLTKLNLKLNLSDCINLKRLNCPRNSLTSIDFLRKLPNPEKLETLIIYNNNIQPTTLDFLKPFINLKVCILGEIQEEIFDGDEFDGDEKNKKELDKRFSSGTYNKFYGSLEPIKNLTKLEQFYIAGTDIDGGIEYIPENIVKLSNQAAKEGKNPIECGIIDCQPLRENAKVKKIHDQLKPFNYDLQAWRLANFDKIIKSRDNNLENKITQTRRELNRQLSWKTKIKHAAIGGLLILGGQKTYHWYYGDSNLTQSPVNHNTWLDNVYLNVPLNEPEYNNLTSLLRLPQEEKAQKSLDKITGLFIQISNKKNELTELINNTKNKLNKVENYLLEQLLAENFDSEELNKLKEVLSDRLTEIGLALVKQQELKDLERNLERLQQTSQLESRVEVKK